MLNPKHAESLTYKGLALGFGHQHTNIVASIKVRKKKKVKHCAWTTKKEFECYLQNISNKPSKVKECKSKQ